MKNSVFHFMFFLFSWTCCVYICCVKMCIYSLQWNSRGYEVAKLFAHKFSYVSPVWLQIQRRSDASYSVNGAHDIDKG